MIRKHELMYQLFGRDTNHKCRECCNFIFIQPTDRRHSKCEVYGVTCSEATDWNGRKTACGQYNIPYNENDEPVLEIVKRGRGRQKAEPIQCKGQITLFEKE